MYKFHSTHLKADIIIYDHISDCIGDVPLEQSQDVFRAPWNLQTTITYWPSNLSGEFLSGLYIDNGYRSRPIFTKQELIQSSLWVQFAIGPAIFWLQYNHSFLCTMNRKKKPYWWSDDYNKRCPQPVAVDRIYGGTSPVIFLNFRLHGPFFFFFFQFYVYIQPIGL